MQVVFVGPVGAGKTCLVQKLAYGETLGSMSTTAACCYSCEKLPGTNLFDTPGDDRFSWAYDGVVHRADVIVYCAPPGEEHSRNYSELNPSATLLLVHTKADTTSAKHNKPPNEFSTSAFTGEGVQALLSRLQALRGNLADVNVLTPKRLKPRKASACF